MKVSFTTSESKQNSEAYGNPDQDNGDEVKAAGNALHDLYTPWLERMVELITDVLDNSDMEWVETEEDANNLNDGCDFGCCLNRGVSLYRKHPSPHRDRWLRIDVTTNSHFDRITRNTHFQNGYMVHTRDEYNTAHDALNELGEAVRDGDTEQVQVCVDRLRETISAMYQRTTLLEERWANRYLTEKDKIREIMLENGWKIHSDDNDRRVVFEWDGDTGTNGRHGVEVEYSIHYDDSHFESHKPDVGVQDAVNTRLHVRGLNSRYLDKGEGFCHGGYGAYATEIVTAKGVDGLPDAAIVCRFAIAQSEGVRWQDPTLAERRKREAEERRRWEEERAERNRIERERRFEERSRTLMRELGLGDIEVARDIRRRLDEAIDAAFTIERNTPPLEVEEV